jgi:hypothetical protein
LALFEEITIKELNEELSVNQKPQTSVKKMIFEDIVVVNPASQGFTSLVQYFIAPFVLIDSNAVLHIPISTKLIFNRAINEIAPHFIKTQKVTVGNQVQIMFQNLKKESMENFRYLQQQQKINPIVRELYKNTQKVEAKTFETQIYKVNLNLVPKSLDFEILDMWNFFEQSFVQNNGALMLFQNQWEFNDSFKNWVTVRAFSSVCNSMKITVNKESNLISSVFIN